jgi:hypothetical protein
MRALVHGDVDAVMRLNPGAPFAVMVLGVFGLQALASLLVFGDTRAIGQGQAGRVLRMLLFAVALLEAAVWGARFFGVLGGPVPV